VFTPDGTVLFAGQAGKITRLDPTGATPPKVIANGRFMTGEVRPTDGAKVLFENDDTPAIDLWVMDGDGGNAHLLYDSGSTGDKPDLQQVRWSPDGTMIAFTCSTPVPPAGSHVCVMNADGSNAHRLTNETDDWSEADFVWSPDSHRIAFNRWQAAPGSSGFLVRPIGIATIGDPSVMAVDTTPGPDGSLFDWSPDGTMLLSVPSRFLHSPVGSGATKPVAIDAATGAAHEMAFEVTSEASWQRTAP
jgi:dipeptidyl aminopeptidase/acylaminoacyl peptidase